MLIFIAFLCVLVLFHSGFFCLLPSLSSPFFLVQSAQMHIHKNFHTNINTSIYLSMSISLYLYIEIQISTYLIFLCVWKCPNSLCSPCQLSQCQPRALPWREAKGRGRNPFPPAPKQGCLPSFPSLCGWQMPTWGSDFAVMASGSLAHSTDICVGSSASPWGC